MVENKRQKFIRLAENRTNKILDGIRLIGNLSNKTVYEYSKQDVDKIFGAIERELSEAKKQFRSTDGGDKFKL